ncbi:MAG: NrtA/SsuA/CpmA family ABC transporter substrate-binding protein [Actinobacteria bacterium]|nr:NrtA/SsuA/CpmA family ABC transporter substrate-binding protein [Actinomycetota bacterium]
MKQARPCAYLLVATALLATVVAAFWMSGCSSSKESIRVAYSPFESTALVWIAEAQDYFDKNGLQVTFREYPTGPAALDGMLKGEADITVGTGEFPMVSRSFQQTQARILATIARSELIYIVGRKDRGIEQPADLKGRRVGTTAGTTSDFFLGRYLEIHGMSMKEVVRVDLKTPDEWVNAVVDGTVDAIATGEPYASAARDRLGSKAVYWSAHSSQPLYALAIASQAWTKTRAGTTRRFLKSLIEAEAYTESNPSQSQIIVQKRLNFTAAPMQTVWSRNQFSVSLDQSLVAAMEDEARWLIANSLVSGTSVPSFLDYINEADLEQVRPEVVDILRPAGP